MISDSGRTLEQRYRSGLKGLYARLKSNYDVIHERLGEEGLDLIEEMSHRYGLEVARRAEKSLGNNDIFSVSGFLLKIFDNMSGAMGEGMFVVESAPGKVVIQARACPLRLDNPQICLAHTAMEKTVVEELNPVLRYRIGKSVAAGDPYCEHILELRAMPGKTRLA